MSEVRPIDANALSKQIKNLQRDFKKSPAKQYVIKILLSMLNDRIQTPTLDYEPVVHAHFIKQRPIPHFPFQNVYECSHCHCITHVGHKYCMECGAKMDEEVKG